eukprot:scaffold91294_cov17-Tisochrysis_lutea.AAC.1
MQAVKPIQARCMLHVPDHCLPCPAASTHGFGLHMMLMRRNIVVGKLLVNKQGWKGSEIKEEHALAKQWGCSSYIKRYEVMQPKPAETLLGVRKKERRCSRAKDSGGISATY